MLHRSVPAILALGMTLVPAAGHAKKVNPENDKRPPSADAGYFLGYPSPTYSWHECTRAATRSVKPPVEGQPPVPRGNKQGAVRFTVAPTAPFVTWEVKKGWRICGAQAGVVLDNPTVSALLLAEVGYTSGPRKGSSAPTGTETIQVTIPTKGIGREGFEEYEGKTFSIRSLQHVTVFVKKAA